MYKLRIKIYNFCLITWKQYDRLISSFIITINFRKIKIQFLIKNYLCTAIFKQSKWH